MFKALQIVSVTLAVVIVVSSQPVELVEAAGIPASKAMQILQANFPNGMACVLGGVYASHQI